MSNKKKQSKWLIKCDKCETISTAGTGAFYCDGCRLICKACGNIVNSKALMKIRGSVFGSPLFLGCSQGPISFWLSGVYARCRNWIGQIILRREYLMTPKRTIRYSSLVPFFPQKNKYQKGEMMADITTIYVEGGKFDITVEKDGGSITSKGLKVSWPVEEEEITFNAAIDGLESFLLSLACEGIDLHDSRIKRALETALESIGNHF